eukprot:TRINITY_DN764_c0_g1_i1.p1 TRINITY_DN764_c0_g1~~TRINITY_DN764_c0_g1_i1.p1  ORF type:complete len:321 (-),score=56.13 TRINITY_DN764_c0_g1_i1:89-1051(-)
MVVTGIGVPGTGLRFYGAKAQQQNVNQSQKESARVTVTAPAGFKPPEPRRFQVKGDQWAPVLSASLPLVLRLGSGAFVQGYKASWIPEPEVAPNLYTSFQVGGRRLVERSHAGERPQKPIEIYEFESCPFCRKVREMVSILDIDVLFYPCPRNGPNFRPKVKEMGGKQLFPYMVDPNKGISMYESDDIIKYLAKHYGNGNVPMMLSLGFLTTLTAGLAMVGRLGKGSTYTPAKLPDKPLDIWAYEASPFCKLVRETLVELELPHVQHSVAHGSPKRQDLYERTGHFQVPYLEDPNTGVKMFESAEIVDYLKATYAILPSS